MAMSFLHRCTPFGIKKLSIKWLLLGVFVPFWVPSFLSFGLAKVDARENESEVFGVHFDMLGTKFRWRWYFESSFGEFFGKDAKATRVPPEGLTDGAISVEKDKETA